MASCLLSCLLVGSLLKNVENNFTCSRFCVGKLVNRDKFNSHLSQYFSKNIKTFNFKLFGISKDVFRFLDRTIPNGRGRFCRAFGREPTKRHAWLACPLRPDDTRVTAVGGF